MHRQQPDNLAAVAVGGPSRGESPRTTSRCASGRAAGASPVSILRVFPRRTKATPDDQMAFVGDPPLLRPPADEVHVSCTFTWDMLKAERLQREWARYYPVVRLGGPAYDDTGTTQDFTPGLYLKPGYLLTSRGCPRHCKHCLVPEREGRLHTLPIHEGWDVLDNNLLACPRDHIEAVLDMLARQRTRARFTGGLDVRLLRRWFVERLAVIPLDVAYFTYDRPRQWMYLFRAVEMIRSVTNWTSSGLRHRIGCYVLVGFDGDDQRAAEHRLFRVQGLGITPFPMIYQPPHGDRSEAMALKRSLRSWMRPHHIYAKSTD